MMKSLVYALFLIFFCSSHVMAQKSEVDNSKQIISQGNGVFKGILRQVVFEAGETSPHKEEYVLETNSNFLVLKNGVDLSRLINKEVTLSGKQNVNTSEVWLNQDQPALPANTFLRQVVPQFPVGQNVIELGLKTPGDLSSLLTLPNARFGQWHTLVVPVNFVNDTSQPMTRASLREKFFTNSMSTNGQYSANDFFQNSSRVPGNYFSLTGDVTEWVTIPQTNANCADNMLNNWRQSAISIIQSQGINTAQYDSIVFVFPVIPGCNITAVGTVGNKGMPSVQQYVFTQLIPYVLESVVNLVEVFVHEIGHNIGARHSLGITRSGIVLQNGDKGCFMADRLRLPNLYQRLTFGWITGRITTLSGPGTYTVRLISPAITRKGAGISKGVLIQLKDSNGVPRNVMRTLEVRQDNYLYDIFTLQYQSFVAGGVALRDGPVDLSQNISQSTLLDTTEETPEVMDNAPLRMGAVYYDPQHEMTIRVVSHTMLWTTVEVVLTR